MRGHNAIEFRILGPLEVLCGGASVPIGGVRQRALLALLLLSANRVVSRDRLIDELLPGTPPDRADRTLRVQVSRLRSVLNADTGDETRLLARAPGYLLRVEPGELDLQNLEKLLSEGHRALQDRAFERASQTFREAESLWRGRPLADLEFEPFARLEIERLEELRLVAAEERIDADLALGEHAAVIVELQELVREHPLRERMRAQQVLALYRSGRQAEALEVYRQTRRLLVEDLGLEPGADLQRLHQAVLDHDPQLDLAQAKLATLQEPDPEATPDGDPSAVQRRQRAGISAGRTRPTPRLAWLLALAGLLLIAFAGAMFELHDHGGQAAAASAPGDSVAVISPAGGHLVRSFRVGGDPAELTVGAGAVWVLNAGDDTVTRIDIHGHAESTFGTGGLPINLAAGDGSLWVLNGTGVTGLGGTPFPSEVSRLDPDTAVTLARLPLSASETSPTQGDIAVGQQGVWVVNPDATVSRIDPASDRVVQRIAGLDASEVATGSGGTWALEGGPLQGGTIVRLSSDSDRITERVRVPIGGVNEELSSLAVGGGALWATDPSQGTLWRIDLSPSVSERTIPLAIGASYVAYGAGKVWVSNGLTGTVSSVDPRTNLVTNTISLGNTPGPLVVGGGALWVGVSGAPGASLPAVSQSRATPSSLPGSICGPVLSGGGRPQKLVVSDLPLHGGAVTVQMGEAIAYVLREHDFRAGRFRLGYQSCDDSTAQSGYSDPDRCTSDAKAYVHNPLVIGVIGPYDSNCAIQEIPIANRGGLAMISPTNSLNWLTHADSLTPPGFVSQLYPTGARNYARVFPADDVEAAAIAEFARRLHLRSVYVLDDGGTYGAGMALHFELSARRLGLHLAGSSRYSNGDTFSRLAARVARSGATAVFLGGVLEDGPLIRVLRRQLGPRFTILADDGFLPPGLLFQTNGPAARGVYIAADVLPNGPLRPAGRDFVAHFAATQHQAPAWAAIYAAQATDVMIDAIARSDGTRRSVTRALFKTCVHNGILGSFCFDANGDPTSTGISIVKAMRPGGDRTAPENTQGAHLVTMIYPPRTLVR